MTATAIAGYLSGQSASQIVWNTFTAGVIGGAAGALGGAASWLMAPVAQGLVSVLGLTCENGLGAIGAFVIGAADGAAFGFTSSFVETAWTTGDVNRALDAGAQSAFWGGLIGGSISVVANAIDPFVCFTAGTLVHKAASQCTVETQFCGNRLMTLGTLATAHLPGDDPTAVDPATWRLVHLQTTKPFGSDNILDAALLRPLTWIAENSAVAGGTIRFCVPELGIDGPADVLAIEPCPPIEPGRGRVITGTFTTASCHVMDLRLTDVEETLHPTPNHRFFSLDRRDYIPAEELRIGERVRPKSEQAVAVESIDLNPTPRCVYNLEIEGEHNFYVGEAGILVHNGCVTGLRDQDAFEGMTVTGETEGGLNRVSAEWRAKYGPGAMREHHLVPQEMLENSDFMQQMRNLGYTDAETMDFVHRQIAELPNANHIHAHAEGWNQTWRTWLQSNPNFTMSDIRLQIRAIMLEFDIPRASLGGGRYGG